MKLRLVILLLAVGTLSSCSKGLNKDLKGKVWQQDVQPRTYKNAIEFVDDGKLKLYTSENDKSESLLVNIKTRGEFEYEIQPTEGLTISDFSATKIEVLSPTSIKMTSSSGAYVYVQEGT